MINIALRVQLAWRVLEIAKDANDQSVIAACRRIITNDRLGRRNDPADLRLVIAFA